MDDGTREIIEKITYYRKKKKITQKELAKILGVSNTTVSSWETGTNAISIDAVNKICHSLDIPISKVLSWKVRCEEYNEYAIFNLFNYYGKGKYRLRVNARVNGIINRNPIFCLQITDNTEQFKVLVNTNITLDDCETAQPDENGFANYYSEVLEINDLLSSHVIEGKMLVYNTLHSDEKFSIIFDEIAWIDADTEENITSWDSNDIAAWRCKNIDGTLIRSSSQSDSQEYIPSSSPEEDATLFSGSEKELVYAFRRHKSMNSAVRKLLEINDN